MSANSRSIRPYLVLLAWMGMAFFVMKHTTQTRSEAMAGLQMKLPGQVGEWEGRPAKIHPGEQEALGDDTELERKIYRRADGREIFVGLVMSGRDRTTLHPPEACLVGQGWQISSGEVVRFPIQGGKKYELEAMRLDTNWLPADAKQGTRPIRQFYFYWFVGKDRMTPRHWERFLWTSYDRVFLNVNHRWGYVTVVIPVGPGGAADAEAEVREFLGKIVPLVQKVDG